MRASPSCIVRTLEPMEGVGHLLSYDESALLREALHALRFDVWEYFGEGEYPSHSAEKDEAEGRVAALVSAWER